MSIAFFIHMQGLLQYSKLYVEMVYPLLSPANAKDNLMKKQTKYG